ncbi:MAG: aldose 1-epimerase [Acidilobus sp.]
MIAISDGTLLLEVYELGAYVSTLKHHDVEVILRGEPASPMRAGMAFMAPFANRVRGGVYEFDGVRYWLPRNAEGHAIHGLVHDKEFEVIDLLDDRVTLSTRLSHEGYPSELSIKVTYGVNGALRASTLITNVGDRRAPLVVGWHPNFVVKGRWRVRPYGVAMRCESEGKIPTGRLSPHEFDVDGDYDDCFFIESGHVELTSETGAILIESNNMKYFQVYTGVKGAVALEPMSGAPDAFHNGMGLSILCPGESREFSFSLLFRPQP